tara:strand:+ start:88962 stop:90320 length:1359 start_codon:yes stop_codon:yes gene_type:complete
MINLYKELCCWQHPDFIAQELTKYWGEDGLIWLDGDNSKLGRWVTLAIDPIEQVCCRGLPNNINGSNPFEALRNLNPGHWTGWLSYEAGAWIEASTSWKSDDMATLWVASHDPIFKFDLHKNELWLEGYDRNRIEKFSHWLKTISKQNYEEKNDRKILENRSSIHIPLESWQWLTSIDDYSEKVANIKKLIEKGDLFQANLATGCTTGISQKASLINVYKKLKSYSPAPFGGLVIGAKDAKNEAIISVSPEQFLKVSASGEIETRPIKGTRPRHIDSQKDSELARDLLISPKDRAENIMIVDLLRNDLGRVCTPGSINIPQLVGLESYAQVHHLTSVIKGSLKPNKTWVDLLEASWPGGSITGAPKIRACQRLNELEPMPRGPYCGSLINLHWNGCFNSNILIRTVLIKNTTLKAYAGCGIVADSDPIKEAEEMNWKILPLLKALESHHESK